MGEDADAFLARYDNTVRLSSEGQPRYDLYWTYHRDRREFDFAVDVATRGWVGLGISPNGDMKGGDIVLGWVTEGGEAHLTDRFAPFKAMPQIDEEQNIWSTAGGSFTGAPKPKEPKDDSKDDSKDSGDSKDDEEYPFTYEQYEEYCTKFEENCEKFQCGKLVEIQHLKACILTHKTQEKAEKKIRCKKFNGNVK